MSFTRKNLDISFELKSGNFGGGGNTSYVKGLRISALVLQPGAPGMGQLQAAVFGLPLSTMNQLTTMGRQIALREANKVKLFAYEEGQQPNLVFTGTISDAWADMQGMPAACLRVQAHAGLDGAVKTTEPTTIKGRVKVDQVFQKICKATGWQFENNGVDQLLDNPYFPGSAYRQAVQAMRASRCLMTVDKDTLAIWKPGGSRSGSTPLISPQTGMVGYPRYRQAAVDVTTTYNSSIQFGGQIQIQSDLTPACGTWAVTYVEHELESEIPHGKWFSTIQCGSVGIQQ